MRIAVSNPDNIGDFILRQPMLAAFSEAGHELLLIVRDFVAPLAADLFPQARVLSCIGNPYGRDFSLTTAMGQEMLQEVKSFAPELFVVAPFQFTQLEEQLATELPAVDCIGLNGYLYQARLETTTVSTIRFATRVTVARDSAELDKNEMLCAAVLGKRVELAHPRMEARPQALAEATARLGQLGLDGRRFWAVCAGDATDKSVRNWGIQQWAELCQGLVEKQSATLLFIGSPDEHASTMEIQKAMGQAGLRTATITDEPVKLDTLVGMLQLAEGYIGKDTGPMHMATALGKPILAVFGGGDWPRFVPAPKSGAVFTVSVPCTGCGWDCPLSRSHCVKDVPVAAVLAKTEAMLRENAPGFSVEVLQPDPVLGAAILRDLLASVRTEQRKVAGERANFIQWHDDRTREIAQLRGELDGAEAVRKTAAVEQQERAAGLEFENRLAIVSMHQAVDDRAELERRLDRFRQRAVRKIADAQMRAEASRGANAALESTVGQAIREGAEWKAKWETASGELDSLRERLEEKTILAATLQSLVDTGDSRYEGALADQEQLLKRKSAELTSALALIPDLREELAALSADLAAREERIGKLERSLETQARLTAHLESRGEEAERDHESTRKLLALVSEDLQVMSEDHAARLVVIETLVKELEETNEDRAARLRLIEDISARLVESERDRAARLRAIEDVSARLAESERDRAAQLRVIEDVSARLAESERDRAARLRVIEDVSARLAESERDRDQRLQLVQQLSSDMETIESDRALRGEQIAKLHEHIANLQGELAALRNLLPYRLLKQLHIV